MHIDPVRRRLVIKVAVAVGAVVGGVLPFFIPGAAVSHAFTDIEARVSYGAFAVFANALFGAILGWGIGALLLYILSRFDDGSSGDPRS